MRYLLAIDSSDQAFDAVRVLTHLSPCEHTILLHAVDVPKASYPMLDPEAAHELYRSLELDMREEGKRLLQRAVTLLSDGVGPVESRLELGSPAEVIVSTAQRERIDLIIMGARGLTPTKEFVFGSVSHGVVTHAPGAVLTVPAPMPALRNILIAVAGLQDAGTVIRFFMHKPFNQPVNVHVLTVLPLPLGQVKYTAAFEPMRDTALKSAQRFAEDIAGRLSTLQCCAIPITKIGPPAATILQYAEELQADLIVVGSHTQQPIARFLLGSVSHKILHTSHRPVLTLR